MYGWIWRKLPGGTLSKLAQSVLYVLVIVVVLLFVVFPAISPHLPFNHVTVDTPPTESPSPVLRPSP